MAGEAAAAIGGLDSGGWVGGEGDLLRARAAEIPPHLDTANTAFGQVSRALDEFADALASAPRRMLGARDQAEQTFGSLASARADRAGLGARIGRLETALDEQVAVATGIRAQVLEAARRSAAAIRAAGRTSPTAGQNFTEDGLEKAGRWASQRLDDLKGFLAEHAVAGRHGHRCSPSPAGSWPGWAPSSSNASAPGSAASPQTPANPAAAFPGPDPPRQPRAVGCRRT